MRLIMIIHILWLNARMYIKLFLMDSKCDFSYDRECIWTFCLWAVNVTFSYDPHE